MAEPVRLGWPSAPFSGPAEWDRGSRAARKSPACSDRVRLRDDRHAPIMARSRASNQLSDSPNPKCWHGPSGLGRDCESSASSQPSDEAGNNVHTGAYAISALACGVLSTSCADESHDQGLRRRRTEPVASRRGPRELRAGVRRYRRTTGREASLLPSLSAPQGLLRDQTHKAINSNPCLTHLLFAFNSASYQVQLRDGSANEHQAPNFPAIPRHPCQ